MTVNSQTDMGFKDFCSRFFRFYSPVLVNTHNYFMGTLNRGAQLGIVLYIVVFAMYMEKEYQEVSQIESVTSVKWNGEFYPNITYNDIRPVRQKILNLIWDNQDIDYDILSEGKKAFFLITRVETLRQIRSSCAEDPSFLHERCLKDEDCIKGKVALNSNGVFNGKCIPSTVENISTCSIDTWCPIKANSDVITGRRPFPDVIKNGSLSIVNYIAFTAFNIKVKSVPADDKCRYAERHDCPRFNMKDMLELEYEDLVRNGGIVGVSIQYDCDFDVDISRCSPSYKFSRLDSLKGRMKNGGPGGLNLRFKKYHSEYNRTLYTVYGIHHQVFVSGIGRRFSALNFVFCILNALKLLTVTTIFVNLIYLVEKQRKKYFKKQTINDEMPAEDDEDEPVNFFEDLQLLQNEMVLARSRENVLHLTLQEEKKFYKSVVATVKASASETVDQELAKAAEKNLDILVRLSDLERQRGGLCKVVDEKLKTVIKNATSPLSTDDEEDVSCSSLPSTMDSTASVCKEQDTEFIASKLAGSEEQ